MFVNIKARTKAVSGPGGLKCSCCRNGRKSRARRDHARIVRRKNRMILREIAKLETLELGSV